MEITIERKDGTVFKTNLASVTLVIKRELTDKRCLQFDDEIITDQFVANTIYDAVENFVGVLKPITRN